MYQIKKALTVFLLLATFAFAQPTPMVLEFNTNLSSGTSIHLPLMSIQDSTRIDWGDGGATEKITSTGLTSHTYATEGTYTVEILHGVTKFGNDYIGWGGADKLVRVTSFGSLPLDTLSGAFLRASSLIEVPVSLPSTVKNLNEAFRYTNSASFTNLNLWNTSNVTDFSLMFMDNSLFNQNIGSWDMTSATQLHNMFNGASSFKQDISDWNVSKVVSFTNFLVNAELPNNLYDSLIFKWSQLPLQGSLIFNAGTSMYSHSAKKKRDSLITNLSWVFYDGGERQIAPMITFDISDTTLIEDFTAFDYYDLDTIFIDSNAQDLNFTVRSAFGKFTPSVDPATSIITISPILNAHGVDTLVITASDGDSSTTMNVLFSITSVNEPLTLEYNTLFTGDSTVTLALNTSVNVTVDWGDGTADQAITTPGEHSHTYATGNGIYTVKVSGALERFGTTYNPTPNIINLTKVIDFGDLEISDLRAAFNGAVNLTEVPTTLPTSVTDLSYTFKNITQDSIKNLSSWTIPNVTTLSSTFNGASNFNQDISGWNPSPSKLENLNSTFSNSSSFNQPLDTWDVSKVTDLSYTFFKASEFNQNLNSWNVLNVKTMYVTFYKAFKFNGNISSWDVDSVTTMNSMFRFAFEFNQDISAWKTDSVNNMATMFGSAIQFNQNISAWKTSKVTDMSSMFNSASAFNYPLNTWDVSNVTDMSIMFQNSGFKQDISDWKLNSATTLSDMFNGDTLSTDIYSSILENWSEESLLSNVSFDAGESQYSPTSKRFRDTLTTKFNWTIEDGGERDTPPIQVVAIADTTLEEDFTAFDYYDLNTIYLDSNVQGFTFIVSSAFGKFTPTLNSDSVIQISSVLDSNGTDTLIIKAITGNDTITTRVIIQITSVLDPMQLVYNTQLSDETTISLQLGITGDSVVVDWGDTKLDTLRTSGTLSHTYDTEGVYTVSINDLISSFGGYSVDNMDKLEKVISFGEVNLSSLAYAFKGANNLNEVPVLLPSTVTNLQYLFANSTTDSIKNIENWNTSNVTLLNAAFYNASQFNQDISGWDVSKIKNFNSVFNQATLFNGKISTWVTDSAQSMISMFEQCSTFNQDLSTWNVSGVTNMSRMFYSTDSFNQDLSSWDVSKVDTMSTLFADTKAFNGNISNWDVDSVHNMSSMFAGARVFNSDISNWDVSRVTDMSSMFSNANAFNQDISGWTVSSVTDMNHMFMSNLTFNQDISGWDVSQVTNFWRMFRWASSFNQNIGNWDVAKATNLSEMFYSADSFDQDLSSWSTGSATNMAYMFYAASSFSTDFSDWDIADVTSFDNFFTGSISVELYDSLLIKWATQSVQNGDTLGMGSNKYSPAAQTARNYLVNTKGWTINDGGLINVAPTLDVAIADTTVLEDFIEFDYQDLNSIFSDLNNDLLRLSVSSTSGKLTPSIRISDSVLVLTSIANINGTDTLIISATDAEFTISDTIVIQITSVNDPAIVTKADSLFFPKNGQVLLQVGMTDAIHPDGLSMNLIASPGANYTLLGDTLVPDTDYTGPLSVALKITDGIDTSAAVTMSVIVKEAMELEFNTSLITDSTVRLPLKSLSGVTVFWGDGGFYHGSPDGESSTKVEHTYNDDKVYHVKVVGKVEVFGHYSSQVSKLDALVQVKSFGDLGLNSLDNAFKKTPHLDSVPANLPTTITSLAYTFTQTGKAVITGLETWNIINVTDLEATFYDAQKFNTDISNWNTINVTTLESTFEEAHSFNQNIGSWNTSKVTNLNSTFYADSAFNQDLNAWDVSKAEDFDYLFGAATSFNHDLDNWNTVSALTMESVFDEAISFNGKVGTWNLSSVESINSMFEEAAAFNQDISNWDVSNVTNMDYAFGYASSFNQDLSKWDVSQVTDMDELFSYALVFNGNITTWNVSKVEDFEETFYGAVSFNQDISGWDVSSATEMDYMFDSTLVFNQDISNWNVSKVEDLEGMFINAKAFNQDISSWDVALVEYLDDMFLNNKMTTDIYDSVLIKWAQLNVISNLTFHAGSSTHSPISQVAKDFLINTKGWTIIDGGSADLQKVGSLSDVTLSEDFTPYDYKKLNSVYKDYQGHNVSFAVSSIGQLTSPTIRSSDSMLVINSKLDLNGIDTLIITASDGTTTLLDSIIINITAVNDTSFTIDSTYTQFQDTIQTIDSVYSDKSDTLVTHLSLERIYDTTFIKLDSLIESGSFAVHIDTITELVINTLDSTVDTLTYIPTLTTNSSLSQSSSKDTLTLVDSVYSAQSDTVVTITITEYQRDTTFTQTDSLSDGVIYGSKIDTLASLDSTLLSTSVDTLKLEVIVNVLANLNSINITYSSQELNSAQEIWGSSQWIIFDTQGREVRSQQFLNSTRKWQLQNALATGNYILVITQGNQVFSEGFTIK